MTMRNGGNQGGGGTSSELVRLCTIPRGRDGAEEFRFSVDEFSPSDGGQPRQYVSIRLWYRDRDGELRPSKTGCTVRKGELSKVLEALQRAERILSGKESIRQPKPEPRDDIDPEDAMGAF